LFVIGASTISTYLLFALPLMIATHPIEGISDIPFMFFFVTAISGSAVQIVITRMYKRQKR